jgi:hypothetical protein
LTPLKQWHHISSSNESEQQRLHSTMDSPSITNTTPLSSPAAMYRKRAGSFALKEDSSNSEPIVEEQRRSSRIVYSPLVNSMVRSNTMRDCHQVHSMFLQCQMDSTSRADHMDNSSEPFVCRTAKKYHAMCLSGERL